MDFWIEVMAGIVLALVFGGGMFYGFCRGIDALNEPDDDEDEAGWRM